MKTKMMKTIALMLVALACAFTPVLPVLGVGVTPLRITRTGIYDGGGSSG